METLPRRCVNRCVQYARLPIPALVWKCMQAWNARSNAHIRHKQGQQPSLLSGTAGGMKADQSGTEPREQLFKQMLCVEWKLAAVLPLWNDGVLCRA